jgi:hypothetical protein
MCILKTAKVIHQQFFLKITVLFPKLVRGPQLVTREIGPSGLCALHGTKCSLLKAIFSLFFSPRSGYISTRMGYDKVSMVS